MKLLCLRQTVCQSIAIASMCSIASEWSRKLEKLNQWLPLALLALNTVFGILLNIATHNFIQQVNGLQNEVYWYVLRTVYLLLLDRKKMYY